MKKKWLQYKLLDGRKEEQCKLSYDNEKRNYMESEDSLNSRSKRQTDWRKYLACQETGENVGSYNVVCSMSLRIIDSFAAFFWVNH